MTSSGSYSYAPSIADLTLNAFGRIQIRRTELTQQHLADAANECNLLQVEMSNRQPNLWTAETYTVGLSQGTASYTLPSRLISPMAVYLTTTTNDGNSYDRILYPYSTFEYAALPDKTVQGPPSSFWYDRETSPIVYLWPVPDGNATYTLNLRILSQIQDANVPNGVTPQIPYRWFDVFAASLAARLAEIYPDALVKAKGPTAVADMWAKAERAWGIAAKEDQEAVPLFIIPGLSGYYSR